MLKPQKDILNLLGLSNYTKNELINTLAKSELEELYTYRIPISEIFLIHLPLVLKSVIKKIKLEKKSDNIPLDFKYLVLDLNYVVTFLNKKVFDKTDFKLYKDRDILVGSLKTPIWVTSSFLELELYNRVDKLYKLVKAFLHNSTKYYVDALPFIPEDFNVTLYIRKNLESLLFLHYNMLKELGGLEIRLDGEDYIELENTLNHIISDVTNPDFLRNYELFTNIYKLFNEVRFEIDYFIFSNFKSGK